EAYAFSSCTLLSQAEENEIIRHADFSAEAIRCYAEKFQVHLRNNCRQLQYINYINECPIGKVKYALS
ncbi:MAG: hypothetical protein SPJ75_07445, partial [Candidatus Onthomorpha sp.]|nr:hypothetical protein [Bacteroidales bacterium]MDY5826315.1 hypothetical protein [Candidatus Onthomorpha sp.]